MINTCIELES